MLLVHLFLPLRWADDAVFYEKATSLGVAEFLSNSARPIIDLFTYFFARNNYIWRLINPFVLTVFVWVIEYLLPFGERNINKIVACFALFPTMVIVDAGFIATTLNYLWSVTFGLLCLIPCKKALCNENLPWWKKVLLLPLLFYACNMQQVCVVLLGFIFCINVFIAFVHKKVNCYLIFQFLIVAGLAVYSYSINVFSENSRMLREINRYFPEFEQLNIFEKIELGFSSTFFCMVSEIKLAWLGFFAFSLFLFAYAFISKSKAYTKIFSTIPAASSLVFGVSYLADSNLFFDLKNFGIGKAVYLFEPSADIIFSLILISVYIVVLSLIKPNTLKVMSALILSLGFGSRLMMGFSPTVWASGYRTFSILFICFIFVTIIIVNNKKQITVA